jgi:hypothetical protein
MAIMIAGLLAPSMAEADSRPHTERGDSRSNDRGERTRPQVNPRASSDWSSRRESRPAPSPDTTPSSRGNWMRSGNTGNDNDRARTESIRTPQRTWSSNDNRQDNNRSESNRRSSIDQVFSARRDATRDATRDSDHRPSWRSDNRSDNDRHDDARRDNDRRDSWRDNDRRDNDRRDSWRNGDRNSSAWRDRDDRRWDRHEWRRDNRYDWQRYRDNHRSIYRIGRYYSPYRNYSYRRVTIGFSLGSLFYGSRYWIDDPWYYRLPEVYGPYRWVRYYDDVLLVNVYTGEVVDVIYDFFW